MKYIIFVNKMLQILPYDTLLEICKNLPVTDIVALVSSCKSFRQLETFWRDLIKRKYNREASTKYDYKFFSEYMPLIKPHDFYQYLFEVEYTAYKDKQPIKYYMTNPHRNVTMTIYKVRSFAGMLLKHNLMNSELINRVLRRNFRVTSYSHEKIYNHLINEYEPSSKSLKDNIGSFEFLLADKLELK